MTPAKAIINKIEKKPDCSKKLPSGRQTSVHCGPKSWGRFSPAPLKMRRSAVNRAFFTHGDEFDPNSILSGDFFINATLDGVLRHPDGTLGRCIDNIFVERLWRSLKYEEVYLYAYDSLKEARDGIARYFDFFNDERPHQALGYQTPAGFYDGLLSEVA